MSPAFLKHVSDEVMGIYIAGDTVGKDQRDGFIHAAAARSRRSLCAAASPGFVKQHAVYWGGSTSLRKRVSTGLNS